MVSRKPSSDVLAPKICQKPRTPSTTPSSGLKVFHSGRNNGRRRPSRRSSCASAHNATTADRVPRIIAIHLITDGEEVKRELISTWAVSPASTSSRAFSAESSVYIPVTCGRMSSLVVVSYLVPGASTRTMSPSAVMRREPSRICETSSASSSKITSLSVDTLIPPSSGAFTNKPRSTASVESSGNVDNTVVCPGFIASTTANGTVMSSFSGAKEINGAFTADKFSSCGQSKEDCTCFTGKNGKAKKKMKAKSPDTSAMRGILSSIDWG